MKKLLKAGLISLMMVGSLASCTDGVSGTTVATGQGSTIPTPTQPKEDSKMTVEEAKAYAEDKYRKMHGIENSCYVEEIEWTDYFYQRMMKREAAEQMGIPIRPFTLWNH